MSTQREETRTSRCNHTLECLHYLMYEANENDMKSRAMASRYLMSRTGIGITELDFQLYLSDYRRAGFEVKKKEADSDTCIATYCVKRCNPDECVFFG